MSVNEIIDHMMYMREKVFWMCDEETKRTGRLCKAVTVIDMNFTSLAKVNNHISHEVPARVGSDSVFYF